MTEGVLVMIALPLLAALTLAFTSWAEGTWLRDEPKAPERRARR